MEMPLASPRSLAASSSQPIQPHTSVAARQAQRPGADQSANSRAAAQKAASVRKPPHVGVPAFTPINSSSPGASPLATASRAPR
jgi:hypothetical protein